MNAYLVCTRLAMTNRWTSQRIMHLARLPLGHSVAVKLDSSLANLFYIPVFQTCQLGLFCLVIPLNLRLAADHFQLKVVLHCRDCFLRSQNVLKENSRQTSPIGLCSLSTNFKIVNEIIVDFSTSDKNSKIRTSLVFLNDGFWTRGNAVGETGR